MVTPTQATESQTAVPLTGQPGAPTRPPIPSYQKISLGGAWIPVLTAVLAIIALELVATDTVAPPPAWVEVASTVAFMGLFAGFFGLSVRSRWGLAGVGVFGLVLTGMALVCFLDGHRNAELVVQAVSGVAVLASVRAANRIG